MHGVAAASVSGLQTALGNEVQAANKTILANVSTTILANARMHSPFTLSISEAYIRSYTTNITEERRNFLAHIDKRPVEDSVQHVRHRMEDAHARDKVRADEAEDAQCAAEAQSERDR